MSPSFSPSRFLFIVCLLVALGGGVFGAVGLFAGRADAGEPLVAKSVCEAHELRALKEQDPDVQIEIPAEFDSPWPSRSACQSYAAAGDEDSPGPLQPIAFSHKHHAGLFQIDCQYCHSGTDRSPSAGVPSVELCMGCHKQFPATYDEFEGIRTLKQHWETQTPIEWEQVYRLPEHVQFQHQAHVRKGVACQTCHGKVEEMDKVYLNPDTKWWPWLLPTKTLEMGWCIQCHRANGATQDCVACHY
jgi:hypothetical protein